MQFITEDAIPFAFSLRGRKPNLTRKEIVGMAIMYVYFELDFREAEHFLGLIIDKQLDHSNCVRWFGKLTPEYINNLVFKIHKAILKIDDAGDYIADSTKLTCDRYHKVIQRGEEVLELETWKIHIFVMYLINLGLVSIVNIFASPGEKHDSPPLRDEHLRKKNIIPGRKVHADKAYFGKTNIKKCKSLGLQPNIVPQDRDYSDGFLKRYIRHDYDNESRKKTRGLVETPFGGMETETNMKLRCRSPHHREIYTCLMGLKHQLRTFMRASLMKVKCLIIYFRTNLWY
ncbi:MAG TPA: transposase [Candidatus Nanoarchaeia archaeon]|nr:transposase [Candidatus Nanoarchaeia archaeon]